MIYVDYVILKQSYDESLRRLKELLDRREEAFTRTLPNAIRYDLQKVMHSVSSNSALEDYIIDNEHLEQQIREAKILVMDRKEMLDLKEEELRKSADVDDRVFYLRSIQKLKVDQIALKLHYSDRASVYYHIRKIKHELAKVNTLFLH